MSEKDPTAFIEPKVIHVQQRFNWDCGVSCVLMMLDRDQLDQALKNFDQICSEEGFGHSTWTIDLCYLLKRFDIKHCMYTTMMGVNEDYKRHKYYSEIIPMDRNRIDRRFNSASAAGLLVHRRALSEEELAQHVRLRGPAIVLVDGALLACDSCKRNKLMAEIRRWFGSEYRGHYVAVVGAARGALRYRDPARPPCVCRATHRAFAAARAAPGTDQDVILVYK